MATHEESGITDETDDNKTQLESATTDEDYEQIQLELSVAMSKYSMNPNKAPLKIVAVGRGSVGKSTLINNFLKLPKERAAKARRSQKPVTTAVTEYKSTINNLVPVHIYDTPGLQDGRIDEISIIKELRRKTEGSIDLLFYVASLQNRLEISDERIIEILTNEFTPRIWDRAIFILSFADQYCHESDYIEYTDESAEVLQEYICKQRGCENLVVKCIRTLSDREPIMNCNNVIAAIPTGQLDNGDSEHWMSNLLVEVFRKSSEENYIPLLLCIGHVQHIDQNRGTNQNRVPDFDTSQPEYHRRNVASDVDQHIQADQREENTDYCTNKGSYKAQDSSIVGDLAVGGLSLAAGGAAGGVAASIAGSTTVVSTTFMGITVGVKTAAALNAVAGIVGATATKTAVVTTAASTGVVGLGIAGGAVVAVGVGLGFKKYVWPIIKETFTESEETKKNQ